MAQLASRPSVDATTLDLGPAVDSKRTFSEPLLQPHPCTPQKAGAQGVLLHPLLLPSLTLGVVLAVALAFGFATPTDKELSGAPLWGRLSNIIGWAYFAMWSISFYPQIWENYRRKSVNGLSFDYELYNLVGFACYSIFNCAFFWSHEIQEAYRQTHGGHANAVQANDVFFSLHAVVITIIVIAQIFVYDRSPKISALCKAFFFTTLLMVSVYLWGTAFGRRDLCSCFTWLSLLYLLSYIKLAITIFKYIPQVILNHTRRSTAGWSIGNVLLDGGGGLLSLGQLLGDAAVKSDWSAVTGDPVKFGLGFVSLVFDFIFAVQHYVLFKEREHTGCDGAEESDVEKPLLAEDHGAQQKA